MADVSAYLVTQASASAGTPAAEIWANLEDLMARRLWHQATGVLQDFVWSDTFKNGGLVDLYDNVILSMADRMNPVTFVKLSLAVAGQIATPEEAMDFLEGILEKVKDDDMAKICAQTSIAELHIQMDNLGTAKEQLEACEQVLSASGGVSVMHAAYYRVSAEWNKIKGDFAAFYADALRFLGCTSLDELSIEEQVVRAFDLGLAALLGEGIYNFGELIAHPILDSLKGTEKAWLVEVLMAFNSGNIARFEELGPQWQAQGDLASATDGLHQKICLLALMELVFKAPAHERNLPFSAIADTTGIPLDQVEMFVMKALSLGLVKGSLDQVAQLANLHWVQPRVLDQAQVTSLAGLLGDWIATVDTTAQGMVQETPELFGQN